MVCGTLRLRSGQALKPCPDTKHDFDIEAEKQPQILRLVRRGGLAQDDSLCLQGEML
jgi:hypothetical protein